MNFLRSFIRFSLQESQKDVVPLQKINKSFEKKNKVLLFSKNTIELISRIPDTDLNQLANRKGFIKWLANEVEKLDFIPKISQIYYIVDYINGTNAPLETLGSFDDALRISDQWHQELAKKQNDDVEHREGAQVVFDFKNGFKLIELEQCDLDAEGKAMGHCVGGYDLSYGKRILSLRDARNKPHVTVEIGNFFVRQIKGKGNKVPVEKYASMIRQWLKQSDLDYLESEDYIEIATPEELEKLAESKNEYIKQKVAKNQNTPKEAFIKLAEDKNYFVRQYVADNLSTPKEILIKLLKDKDSYVRKGAIANPNIPIKILEKFSEDKKWDIRHAVARNPNATKEILLKLSEDRDEYDEYNVYVKDEVIKNPNVTKEILIKLSNDENANVRNHANKIINEKGFNL